MVIQPPATRLSFSEPPYELVVDSEGTGFITEKGRVCFNLVTEEVAFGHEKPPSNILKLARLCLHAHMQNGLVADTRNRSLEYSLERCLDLLAHASILLKGSSSTVAAAWRKLVTNMVLQLRPNLFENIPCQLTPVNASSFHINSYPMNETTPNIPVAISELRNACNVAYADIRAICDNYENNLPHWQEAGNTPQTQLCREKINALQTILAHLDSFKRDA